ncbi:hypothetical protein C8Q79DRAFT_291347 [Trametes meyenii]|nr:hypothetical protein C8Q79DRAFT_291347 [Trametes meyenii]
MPPPLHPPKMDSTLGAAFLGHSASMLLYGVTSMQTYIYYRRSQNDGRVLKLSVLVLWFLDSLHAALITAALYWYCVTHFTDVRAIEGPYWPIPVRSLAQFSAPDVAASQRRFTTNDALIRQ